MLATCHVCHVRVHGANGHHVVPQASGGRHGPQVPLCATCHTAVHLAARALARGADGWKPLSHLDATAGARAMALAVVASVADRHGPANPNPVLLVAVDPRCLRALDHFRDLHGFGSRERAVDAILRALAVQYGLVADSGTSKAKNRKRLSTIRAAGSNAERLYNNEAETGGTR